MSWSNILHFPKYSVGQIVHHEIYRYRGVIFSVDTRFQGSDEWYEYMAKSRPPKEHPWYHVLVHNAIHTTYVAEQNLTFDDTMLPIDHPLIIEFFNRFVDGRYVKYIN